MDMANFLYGKRARIADFLEKLDISEKNPVMRFDKGIIVVFEEKRKRLFYERQISPNKTEKILIASLYAQKAFEGEQPVERLDTWLRRAGLGEIAVVIGFVSRN